MVRILCLALLLAVLTGCGSAPSTPTDPLVEAEKIMADFYLADDMENVPPDQVVEALRYLYQARAQGKDPQKIKEGVAHCLKILEVQEKIGGVKAMR